MSARMPRIAVSSTPIRIASSNVSLQHLREFRVIFRQDLEFVAAGQRSCRRRRARSSGVRGSFRRLRIGRVGLPLFDPDVLPVALIALVRQGGGAENEFAQKLFETD